MRPKAHVGEALGAQHWGGREASRLLTRRANGAQSTGSAAFDGKCRTFIGPEIVAIHGAIARVLGLALSTAARRLAGPEVHITDSDKLWPGFFGGRAKAPPQSERSTRRAGVTPQQALAQARGRHESWRLSPKARPSAKAREDARSCVSRSPWDRLEDHPSDV